MDFKPNRVTLYGATLLETGGPVDLEHLFEQMGPLGIEQIYLLINRIDLFFDPFLNVGVSGNGSG